INRLLNKQSRCCFTSHQSNRLKCHQKVGHDATSALDGGERGPAEPGRHVGRAGPLSAGDIVNEHQSFHSDCPTGRRNVAPHGGHVHHRHHPVAAHAGHRHAHRHAQPHGSPGHGRRLERHPSASPADAIAAPPPEGELHRVARDDVEVVPGAARAHDASAAGHRPRPRPRPRRDVERVHRPGTRARLERRRAAVPGRGGHGHPAGDVEHAAAARGGSRAGAPVPPPRRLGHHAPRVVGVGGRVVLLDRRGARRPARDVDPPAHGGRRELLAREQRGRARAGGAGERVHAQRRAAPDEEDLAAHRDGARVRERGGAASAMRQQGRRQRQRVHLQLRGAGRLSLQRSNSISPAIFLAKESTQAELLTDPLPRRLHARALLAGLLLIRRRGVQVELLMKLLPFHLRARSLVVGGLLPVRRRPRPAVVLALLQGFFENLPPLVLLELGFQLLGTPPTPQRGKSPEKKIINKKKRDSGQHIPHSPLPQSPVSSHKAGGIRSRKRHILVPSPSVAVDDLMSAPTASSQGENLAEVVVVRHGETSGNASRIIQGQMDLELNETGRQQAVMVARRLSKEAKPAAVYSSDLKRAAETARTIATACDVPNLVLDPALRERHMGDLHGLKFDDAVSIKPDAYKAFSSDDRNQEIPGGGESLDQLSERCVSYLNAIAVKHKGERVIVVSHGAAIEEICRHADPTSSMRKRIPNTSISVIRISGVDGHWIPEKFGDVSHLNEDGFLQDAFGGDGASA
ncbi:hypothetical protein EJB05_29651, partial [Eragrostis curvula]